MIQIRQGVFETNSSSTHAISVCLASDYDALKRGEMLICRDSLDVLPINEAEQKNDELRKYAESKGHNVEDYLDWNGYITYDELYNSTEEYEWYSKRSNIGGVEVVAFGYYGYDY